MPDIDNIEESESESEDAAEGDSNNIDAALSSDDDLELLYDTSSEYEEANGD
ncbi:hypothetical protein DVH05_001324 [Phytophthora capsici]|nr:hypothetical protein DVH05_000444 [Phytophthora capsici]KAG1713537.1 hypothetical protein DVH05_001324 [Phytophthora capsici]